jgi:c-di-GMP-binding flagellar brake protein YcgR
LEINKEDSGMADARKYARVSMIASAEVKREGDDSLLYGLTVNISMGGVGIYVKEPLSGRIQAKIYFSYSTGEDVGITVDGTVAWQKRVEGWYSVGIQFDGLNPHDHAVIYKFLEQKEMHLFRSS